MNQRADAVRAISQQFQNRTNDIVDGVLVHLSESNSKEILGPTLSPLTSQGSLKSLVTFAIYADVLRVVRDVVIVDGNITDDEIQAGLGMLSVLATSFAKVRKDYAAHDALSISSARAFLTKYEADTGLFGYRNDSTRWSGRKICSSIEARCNDPEPLARLNESLFEWARAIAASDTTSQAEHSLLQSLASILHVTDSQPKPVNANQAEVTIGAMKDVRNAVSSVATRTPPREASTPPQVVSPEPHKSSTVAVGSERIPALKEKPQKDCPFCGERILATAVKCKHCGEMLEQIEPSGPRSTESAHESSALPADVQFPEIKRTCNKCGKVWFSDSKEEDQLAMSIKANEGVGLILGLSGLAAGYGSAGSFSSVDSQQRIQGEARSDSSKLEALRRCPSCNSKTFKEIKPLDPNLKPKVPVSPQVIWGNVLIGFGCLFGLNGFAALGAGGGASGLLAALVIFGLGGALVYGGLYIRKAIKPSGN